MARAQGLYSRVISWLKIILPLVALGLLSTIFLLSRDAKTSSEAAFLEALQQAEDGLRERVSSPKYAGKTDRGDLLTMTAKTAHPRASGNVDATDFSAVLETLDGNVFHLTSDNATLLEGHEQVVLQEFVRVQSSSGYIIETDSLTASTNKLLAESHGPISGSGPLGEIQAGKLRIEPLENGTDVQLLFTDGVKLIYLPQNK